MLKLRIVINVIRYILYLYFTIIALIFMTGNLYPEENNTETVIDTEKKGDEADKEEKKADGKNDNILLKIPADAYKYLKDRPDEMKKYLKSRMYYKLKEGEKEKDIETIQDEADLSGLQESAHDEIKNIAVLVGEIPIDGRGPVFAPIFMAERKAIFETKTDFSFKWVGYKATLNFSQDKFPWESTKLTETVVGSFLYASGTNIGFNRGKLTEEKRFYTNYFSEIISLKKKLPWHMSAAITLDSRQYFFVKRSTPEGFQMPLNHINIFPRLDLSFDLLKEKGIDQLTSGLKLLAWAGYGKRNRWEKWGEPNDMQTGEEAKTFVIYSLEMTCGLLFRKNHNLVARAHYKGGMDNDFLTMPRFGGTIDNAKLDVVHGFSLDQFRVKRFGIINWQYGFNIVKRLRFNLFFDYAYVYSPGTMDIFGSGWGVRIIAWGGLPVWFTHGIGRIYRPEKQPVEQMLMLMTAAGW